jgi:predicted nucleic acid-binding protein
LIVLDASAVVAVLLDPGPGAPHTSLMQRIWEVRENLTAYDAAYVALAEALDAPLVTMDTHSDDAPGLVVCHYL